MKSFVSFGASLLIAFSALAQDATAPLTILPGHSNDVDVVAASSTTIATGSYDFKINLYKIDSPYTLFKTLGGHMGPITTLAFSKNGKQFASGGEDRLIQLWDSTLKVGMRLESHKDRINCLAFDYTGRYLFSGSDDKTVLTWDTKTGKVLRTFTNTQPINSIVVSPDGKYLFIAASEPKIKVVEASTGKIIKTIDGHTDAVNDLVITRDGKFLISGSNDKTARVWNLTTGKQARILPVDCWKVLSIALSDDGKYAVTGCNDGSIKIWEWETGKLVNAIDFPMGIARNLAFGKTNKHLLAAFLLKDGTDYGLRIYNTKIPEPLVTMPKTAPAKADTASKVTNTPAKDTLKVNTPAVPKPPIKPKQ